MRTYLLQSDNAGNESCILTNFLTIFARKILDGFWQKGGPVHEFAMLEELDNH